MRKLILLFLIAPLCAQSNNARMLTGVNYQTGTTYTFVAKDMTRPVVFNNASSVSAFMPSGATFQGAIGEFVAINNGAGTVTITCVSCTINGGATVTLATNQSATIFADGVNYVANTGGSGTGGVGPGTAGFVPVFGTSTTIANSSIQDTAGAVSTTEPVTVGNQLTVSGTGAFALIGTGGSLPTAGASNGGFGIFTGGLPEINVNNAWFLAPYIQVGGSSLATNLTNFSNTTPTAPTNGINVSWQKNGSGSISAAIVGDGNAAHALCGNGTFGACTAGGATALSGLTAAVGANTIANGNNPQIWNWAQTTNSQSGITFGETSAATAGTLTGAIANQANVTISGASASTATPLNISQGSVTGTTAFPAMQIQTTWNNAGLTGEGLVFNATCTACNVASKLIDLQIGGTTQFSVAKNGNVTATGNVSIGGGNFFDGTSATSNISFCGGTCSSNTNGTTGGAVLQGNDDGSNGASVEAGYAILRGGGLTNASPNLAATPGLTQVVQEYKLSGTVAAVGDIVHISAVDSVADAGANSVDFVGVAQNTSGSISVVFSGLALVKVASSGPSAGDILCTGSTAAQATDNGSTVCPNGQMLGIVVDATNAATYVGVSGVTTGTFTISTGANPSLVLAQIRR